MALAARLIESIAVTGSRKADGSVNASGKVFIYEPGTNTAAPGFTSADCSEAWTLTEGGIPLDVAGKADIWVQDAVDVRVEDSDGAVLATLADFNKVGAAQVEIVNENYTGAVTDDVSGDVTQELGGQTDLDTVLTNLGESLGPDGEYQESAGATPRPYIEVIRGMQISVKDFGARGDGLADDTAAIQLAFNEAKRLSTRLYVDPGTYRTSSALSLAGASGVQIVGAGLVASTILCYSSASNILALSTCTSCGVRDLSLAFSAASTYSCLVDTSGILNRHDNVSAYLGTVNIDVSGSQLVLRDCVSTPTLDAASRGLRSAVPVCTISGGNYLAGGGASIEFTGSAQNTSIHSASFGTGVPGPSSAPGILFSGIGTGHFSIFGCPTLGAMGSTTTPIDTTALTAWPSIRQWGNGIKGYTTTGSTHTPNIMVGNPQRLTGASGATTVNAPVYTPTGIDAEDRYFDFEFINNAGGTTWTLNAIYVLDSILGSLPTTAGHRIYSKFYWDSATSKLREVSRTLSA
jgi:hypothetical protein